MTEQKPMTTNDMPQSGQAGPHRVKIGGREITLDEARAAMSPALRHQIDQQHPRAHESPALAQQLVDAYAAEHERQNGEKWTPAQRDAHQGEQQRRA